VRLKKTHLLLAVVLCAVSYALSRTAHRITPAFPHLAAQIEGTFPRDGQYPGEPLDGAAGVQLWGSWGGSDANTGTLTLGPFIAPEILHFGVGGYPAEPGNEIRLSLVGTAEIQRIKHDNVGERWRVTDVELPAHWVGRPITIVAVDRDAALGGWLAISEPLRGGLGEGNNAFLVSLAAWSLDALVLGVLWCAALRIVSRGGWIAPEWTPLVAGALVATAGYVLFWIFFASALAGKIFSFALVVAALAWMAGRGRGILSREKTRLEASSTADSDARAATRLLVAISFFYVALLHLFPSSRDIYDLAANRFCGNLPGDNALTHDLLASRLLRGEPLRQPGADWLSSDRPPLQAGWQLLTLPAAAALRMDPRVATCMAAIWFQAIWVFAAYGLLRALGLARAKSGAWIAVLALSGFFLQHTVFTWPKLSAAAFTGGAFGLWALGSTATGASRPRKYPRFVLGALLAALGWLSHGGAAFSLLVLAPWVAGRVLRGEWRAWLAAAGVFALCAAPWIAYQKFYDPPGNRLLKWHLGGQIDKDARGTWQTIRESYAAIGWHGALARKRENLATQLRGDWRLMFDFSRAHATERRTGEFFYTARAFTWWLFGVSALLVVATRRDARARFAAAWRAHVAVAAWSVLTIVGWCLLMFIGYNAVIHQGSFAAMLALFAVFSAWFELAGGWAIAVVGALQAATFATTWLVANEQVHGPPAGAPFVVFGALGIIAVVALEFRRTEDATPASSTLESPQAARSP